MPLFIDDEQISPQELATKLGLGKVYDRLLKKPSFKMHSGTQPAPTTIKQGANMAEKPVTGIKNTFWFKDTDGHEKRLRYAKSRSPKIEGGVRTFVYEPAYTNVSGSVVAFQGEADKALFMYLRPENPLSPFKGKRKGFTFVDPVAETAIAASNMSDIQKALTHATTAEEEELVIIAKALKILVGDEYDLDTLRVQMQQYAINPVTNKKYILGMTDEILRIEGRIINMVDKGIITLERKGSGRQWVWSKGAREGEYLGDMIMNVNEDARQRLFSHMKANFSQYVQEIRDTTIILQSERKLREFLKEEPKVDVPAHLASINTIPAEKSIKDEIFDFQSSKMFVEKKGYPKTPGNVKQLEVAVEEGVVTYENVDAYLVQLYERK